VLAEWGDDRWLGRPEEERRQRGIPAWASPEGEEWPWRPAEPVAALCKVRNQFVSDVDFDGWLSGAGPEVLHSYGNEITLDEVERITI
jgi:hypothetical protein